MGPLPVGEATRRDGRQLRRIQISIHASRGGSDLWCSAVAARTAISIHASRGGSDWKRPASFWTAAIFQSTLPVGEATVHRTGAT